MRRKVNDLLHVNSVSMQSSGRLHRGLNDLPAAVETALTADGMRQLGAAATRTVGRVHGLQLVRVETPAFARPG